MKTIDCRNMTCPVPVVTVKRAMEEGGADAVQVLVDPGAPRENVTRFAVNRGYTVQEQEMDGGISLLIRQPGKEGPEVVPVAAKTGASTIFITSDRLGEGPEELGRLLMKNFIITLLDMEQVPDRMLFVNSGVLLTTEGSEVLEVLEQLGNKGVEVMSCGVCLDFFHRKEKLRAGTVTNMFTIAESLLTSESVVRL